MDILNDRQLVEYFHLQFLRFLSKALEKNLYAIKGGCNLRFFFNSIRYSEDLDIDVKTIAKETLQKKINKLLSSTALQNTLQAEGVTINTVITPKQTETTQRWKILLNTQNRNLPINTKIEFSRRTMTEETLFEPIGRNICQAYHLPSTLLTHYQSTSATLQKIHALLGRTETQARDVFDLYLLINRNVDLSYLKKSITHDDIVTAQEKALGIAYDDYKSQVVAYLEPEHQNDHDSTHHWNYMVAVLIEFLESINNETP